MSQRLKYKEKLERRSIGIKVCQSIKDSLEKMLKDHSTAKLAIIEAAEELNWMARCYLHEKIGARNNFNGYWRYSWKILKNLGAYYTK